MTTEPQLSAFITRHRLLLSKERNAEVQRSSLLLSNCGPKLLEQKGLALSEFQRTSTRVDPLNSERAQTVLASLVSTLDLEARRAYLFGCFDLDHLTGVWSSRSAV